MVSCSGLWDCSTADGKLQAIATLLGIIASVIIAIYTQKASYKKEIKLSSEKGKKIFLDNKVNFEKATSSIKVIFNKQEKRLTDINLLIRNVAFQIDKIKESDLAQISHSTISPSIFKFIDTGRFTVRLLVNIEHFLKESGDERTEDFLVNKDFEEKHELMNSYCDEVEENCKRMQEIFNKIDKFYK